MARVRVLGLLIVAALLLAPVMAGATPHRGAASPPASSARSTLHWSGAVTADPSRGDPTSISCPASGDCVAVDASGNAMRYQAGAWSDAVTIDPRGNLWSVSCPDATFCVAVGDAGRALTDRNGTWSAPVDIDGAHGLVAVSCPASKYCEALDSEGYAFTGL